MSRSRLIIGPASLCLALLLAAVAIAPAGAVSAPQRILAGPKDQTLPSANSTYMIWTQNSEAFSNRYHAYGKVRGTAEVFRLNPNGTRGFAGGIDPDQDRAIYQQIDGQASDLYTINLATRGRLKLPAPINTDRWEWGPRISNAFYLFARDAGGETTLFLYDRAAETIQALVRHDLTRFYVSPGAVGERYATWSVCGPITCSAFVRDTETDRTRKIPASDGWLDMPRSWTSGRGSSIPSDRGPAAGPASASCACRWRPSGRRRRPSRPFRAGSTSTSRCPSSRWPRRSTSGSHAIAAPRSRATSIDSATSPELHARASGLVRHVGPPSPFREISSPR